VIAYYSSLAMVTSVVLYLIAVATFGAEWAAVRSARPVRELVAVGAGATGTDDAEVEVAPATASRSELLGRAALGVTVVALATHVAGVVLRGIAAGRAPWGNMYEFITTSLAFVGIAFVVLAVRFGMRWLGLPVTLLLVVGQGLAVTVFYVEVSELMPALHSVWFVIHIVAAAIAGAAFNVGAIAAGLYLVKSRAVERGRVSAALAKLPDIEALDRISFRFHAFAFPLWTFTIAAGAIWAQYAWGSFWNWDPKETWSLVTWIIYAAYLHARTTVGWKGKRAAVVALVGVFSFWFNFVGINLLTTGLHAYGGL
jgi:cytochrome c-type biogenesis protein CcsB